MQKSIAKDFVIIYYIGKERRCRIATCHKFFLMRIYISRGGVSLSLSLPTPSFFIMKDDEKVKWYEYKFSFK